MRFSSCTHNLNRLIVKAMMKQFLILCCCFFVLTGCENTNLELATEAGLDAIKAATLSDKDVKTLALRASRKSDKKNTIASINSTYGKRLHKLVGQRYSSDEYEFNFKVYLSNQVNAFAMADGTIRIYSGLMDMMDDEELLFVVGHEMGHVVKKHIKKKIMLAYAASAARKAVASQGNLAGDIARSGLGGLVQVLLNAQFSQEEERQADDYGIFYLKEKGVRINAAVSALKKLATLGNNHSFLSSHPAPGARAKRLQGKVDQPHRIGELSFFEKTIAMVKQFYVKIMN